MEMSYFDPSYSSIMPFMSIMLSPLLWALCSILNQLALLSIPIQNSPVPPAPPSHPHRPPAPPPPQPRACRHASSDKLRFQDMFTLTVRMGTVVPVVVPLTLYSLITLWAHNTFHLLFIIHSWNLLSHALEI